jgi:excisionase family DNA binding protein
MGADTMIGERIFTVDQVAELLSYHRKTIIKWITNGELVASKLGTREYRIRESDLNDFMRRKQIKPQK